MDILREFDSQTWILIFLALAVFRIYLEVIKFNLSQLPIAKVVGKDRADRFHRYGFYVSVGYFMLYGPSYLMS